ncbi:MAG: hypothetical protein NXI15_02510 [Gammaproteobacteria bacterium]|nr:hypothetical protein [Gammaproteobacteria bacterium]
MLISKKCIYLVILYLSAHAGYSIAESTWHESTCSIIDDGSSVGNGILPTESVELVSGDSGTTLYYPANLPYSGCTFPVIGWGNGAGTSGGSGYVPYFERLASYGFVVAVSHSPAATSGTPILDSVQRALELNNDVSSIFYQKLESNFGLMGKSLGSIAASRDIGNSTHSVQANTYGTAAVMFSGSVTGVSKPGLWITGDADFLADMTEAGYTSSTELSVFVTGGPGVTHLTLSNYTPGIELATSFMRCNLRGDPNTCEYVLCEDCQVANWVNYQSSFLGSGC